MIRPVIPIELSYKGRKVRYEVLVDSGADMNVFDAELADILGITFTDGVKTPITGVTGSTQDCYVHTIKIITGGWEHKAEVAFMRNMAKNAYGMVGQKGFFDQYKVCFDREKLEIELKQQQS